MSNYLSGVKGNTAAIKQKLIKHRQAGEKALAAQYKMTFEGFPDLEIVVASTQLPGIRRAQVESYGPMGTKSDQQGPVENGGEFTAQIFQTLKGKQLKTLREMVKNKTVIKSIDVALTPESTNLETIDGVKLEECWIAVDAVDLANDSVTEVLRIPITIYYVWSEPL